MDETFNFFLLINIIIKHFNKCEAFIVSLQIFAAVLLNCIFKFHGNRLHVSS